MGLGLEGTKGKVLGGRAEGSVCARVCAFLFLQFRTIDFVMLLVVRFYQREDGFWTGRNNACPRYLSAWLDSVCTFENNVGVWVCERSLERGRQVWSVLVAMAPPCIHGRRGYLGARPHSPLLWYSR